MPSVQFGNSNIKFKLSRRQIKQVAITVDENCDVLVAAPKEAPKDKVFAAVKRKSSWILNKQRLVRETVINQAEREYISGEGFIYLGRTYRLKLQGKQVVMKNGRLLAPRSNTESMILDWYKEKAINKIEERVKYWSQFFPVKPFKVLLGDQKTRWGSCDKKGVLRINWKVIFAPLKILDYVVAHELAHLKHHDHGKQFWNLLESVMPDYEKRREWLRVHGGALKL